VDYAEGSCAIQLQTSTGNTELWTSADICTQADALVGKKAKVTTQKDDFGTMTATSVAAAP
jgi:hypothetical protein